MGSLHSGRSNERVSARRRYLKETATITAIIFAIIATATFLSVVLTYSQIPQQIVSYFTDMGATFALNREGVQATARQLHGAHIELKFPSVGATENILTAAVLARGVTSIDNAAREPEIVDLCNMLVDMGAQISGIGTDNPDITCR